jgi:hypothetical protein
MNLHIIFVGEEILLSKKAYASWQEIQRDYADYKASLGPWPPTEVVEYLCAEYPDMPKPAMQVAQLAQSAEETCAVR